MSDASWQAFYEGKLQSVYALVVVPALFLFYRAVRGRTGEPLRADAARFVDAYTIVFAVETILDATITGLLVPALGVDDRAATAVLVGFVLLGDFRVYLLVFALLAVAARERWSRAIPIATAATFVVPVVAYASNAALHRRVAGLSANSIWLIYEWMFAAVALGLRQRLLPARIGLDPALHRYLATLLLYVTGYYVMWGTADLIIQLGGFDVGWLLRAVPNQLYYSFWVPLVYVLFFSRR